MLTGFWRAGEATWFETRQSVENLAEAGRFAQAIEREEELLTLIEEAFGAPSIELSDAYLLMGSIHSLDAQYFEAEGRILQALQLIEDIEGPISTRLIAPFVALGENYHSSEDYDLALGAYNEARNLGRRGFAVLGHRRDHSDPVRRRSVADAASASGRCRQPAKGPAVAQ
jgi:tetratricopeptide (TPR) repeat protein